MTETWFGALRGDPIPWLLEPEDPSVRYWTLVDLLDHSVDEPDVRAARAAIPTHPPVAQLLAAQKRDGYWVKSNFKVELTKEEKRQIGRPSSPRWELDLVAYKGEGNQVLVVECKSYLDSPGVMFKGFDGSNETHAQRYKLFNETVLRETVLGRLERQLVEAGACAPSPNVRLCLAAGNIATLEDRRKLEEHFNDKGWDLYDDEWLRKRLAGLADAGYEDSVASIVSKLLLKD